MLESSVKHSIINRWWPHTPLMKNIIFFFLKNLLSNKPTDFSGCPVVKASPSNGGMRSRRQGWCNGGVCVQVSSLVGEVVRSHRLTAKNKKAIKQKQYCNEVNKLWKWSTSKKKKNLKIRQLVIILNHRKPFLSFKNNFYFHFIMFIEENM